MYTIPFLLRTSENGKRLIRVISQDVDRKYSPAELIHTRQIWRAYLTTVTIQPVQW